MAIKRLHPHAERLLASFLAILIVYGVIIGFSSRSNTSSSDALDTKLSSSISQKRINVYTQISSVDPLKGEARARVEPWPLDESLGYPYRSGWMPKQDIALHVDAVIGSSAKGDNLYVFPKDVPTGGIDVVLDEKSGSASSNVSRYPFDSYTFEVPMSATYTDAKGATQDLPILPQDYTKAIDTFHVDMKHVLWTDSNRVITNNDKKSIKDATGEYNAGIANSVFTVSRSSSTRILTFIILILMLTGLASVTTMALMVASTKRPPTLSALTWAAALTFALISLRGLFPGSPPVGILIDKIVYFPTLLITLVCSLSILVIWTRRDDYVN